MGDIHDMGHTRRDPVSIAATGEQAGTLVAASAIRAAPSARASGEPIVTIDLASIVGIEPYPRFLRKLACACKPWIGGT
jgi:hypothetical protein